MYWSGANLIVTLEWLSFSAIFKLLVTQFITLPYHKVNKHVGIESKVYSNCKKLPVSINTHLFTATSLSCANGNVRLRGGDEFSGRVEICLGGRWGTVCTGFVWTDISAQVVCRTLGLTNVSGIAPVQGAGIKVVE